MNQTKLLLRAYYEALYELLETNRAHMEERIEKLLAGEFESRSFGHSNTEKFRAYLDAAMAFLTERMEMYNPIGIQFTFERTGSKLARELELQLNWYDSSDEFAALTEAAAAKALPDMTDEQLHQLAMQLITEAGAFPDRTILRTYQIRPALAKLPDYALAKAIEEVIKTQ